MRSLYESIFPIISIEEDKMLNKDNVISIAFSIDYPPVFLQSKEYYASLHEDLINLISLLPDHTILQSLSLFDEETYKSDLTKPLNFLEKYNALYYRQRIVPTQSEYLIFSFANKPLSSNTDGHTFLKMYDFSQPPSHKDTESKLIALEKSITTVVSTLPSIYQESKIKRLNNNELLEMLYRYSSLDYKESPANLTLPKTNFKTQCIAGEHFKIFSLDDGKSFTVSSQPKQTRPENVGSSQSTPKKLGKISQSHIFPLTIGLPFKHAVSTTIQKLNRERVMKELLFEEKVLQVPSSLGHSLANKKIEAIEEYRDLIDELGYEPVYTSSTIIISDKNKQILESKAEALKTASEKLYRTRATQQTDADETALLFLSTTPGNAPQIYDYNLSTNVHAVCMLPKESHYRSDGKGIVFQTDMGSLSC